MLRLKRLWQNRIFFICLALSIILFGSVVGKNAESEMRAIITAVGVDLSEIGVELTVSVLTPKNSANPSGNLQSFSAKGTSLNKAFTYIGLKVGKKVGLAHCEIVVMGSETIKQDIAKHLDYFLRSNNLTTNSVLIASKTTAKEVIEAISDGDNPNNVSLRNMIELNDNFIFSIKMNVENFYKSYYSKPGITILGVFEVLPEDEMTNNVPNETRLSSEVLVGETGEQPTPHKQNKVGPEDGQGADPTKSEMSGGSGEQTGAKSGGGGGESSNVSSENATAASSGESSGEGGGEGAGGQEGEKKALDYSATLVLLKNGKFVRELSPEEVSFLQTIHSYTKSTYVLVRDVDTPEYKDATITLETYDKRIKKQTYFNNGIPVYKYSISANMKLDEISAEEYSERSLYEISNFFYDSIKTKVREILEKEYAIVINNMKEHNTDLLAVYNSFYKFHKKEWLKYVNSLESEEDYLSGVVFELDVKLNLKY